MIGLAFHENFNNDVLRGLLRRRPELDVLRVQDAGLRTRDDPALLAWAAVEGRSARKPRYFYPGWIRL